MKLILTFLKKLLVLISKIRIGFFNLKNRKKNNIIIAEKDVSLFKTKIKVAGKNNILYLYQGIKLYHCVISFKGDNSIIYLCNSGKVKCSLRTFNDSVIYIGSDCYLNPQNEQITIKADERQNIIIGKSCILSYGITISTSDVHCIFNTDGYRINKGGSVILGERVWVGHNASIFKNSYLGSGSVIGAQSVVAGKKIQENELWVGNPARCKKDKIAWLGHNVASFNEEQISKFDKLENFSCVAFYSNSNILDSYKTLDDKLKLLKTSKEKFDLIKLIKK